MKKKVAKQSRKTTKYRVTCEYKGQPCGPYDKMLDAVAGKRSDGGGYSFVDGHRDVSWSTKDRETADDMVQRLKAVPGTKRVRRFAID